MNVSGGESEEQYRTGAGDVPTMNQGRLEVVKQEMARVNTESLRVMELKCTGRGNFNSEDLYIYYCGQEFLRRNGVDQIVNRRVQNAVPGCSLKNDNDFGSFPRQAIQYHSNPSPCSNH